MSRCSGYVRVCGGVFERQPQCSPHTRGFYRRQLIQDDDTFDHVGNHSSERAIFDIYRNNSGDCASRRASDIYAGKAANCAVYADDAGWAAKTWSSQPRLVNS